MARLAAEASHQAVEDERVAGRCCTVHLPIVPPEIQRAEQDSQYLPTPLRRAGFKVPSSSPLLFRDTRVFDLTTFEDDFVDFMASQ